MSASLQNVLFVVVDNLRPALGAYGDAVARTPHMDALAKRGRNFLNAHCAVPVCSASRASVMSGVAATTHGSYELGPRYEQLPALKEVELEGTPANAAAIATVGEALARSTAAAAASP